MNSYTNETDTTDRHIMLAEDDADDQEFLIDALRQLDASLKIHVESSGEKAVEYLQKLPETQIPCLIILDYNLPKLNGHEILTVLAQDERFQNVKKVVWSTSGSLHFQKICLDAGAEAYLVKPTDISGIEQVARTMLRYCS